MSATSTDTGTGALPREIRRGGEITVVSASQPPASPFIGRQPVGTPSGVYVSVYELRGSKRQHVHTRFHDRETAVVLMPWLEPLLGDVNSKVAENAKNQTATKEP